MPSTRTLDHRFRPVVDAFLRNVVRPLFPGVLLTSARRTRAEQARLYQAHLRGENQGLPAMPPGTSDHEIGMAVDLARPGRRALDDPWLKVLGAIWTAPPYHGRWTARDPVHFASPASLSYRRTRRRQRR